jgi:trehalose/maltose hydrolase-like predicted phosphorylase
MMEIPQFSQDNWMIIKTDFDPIHQNQEETILTIGNGYLSTRGTFEERYTRDQQSTLIHGMWDDVPIGFTELANAPDWTAIEIWINGERFGMGQGKICNYSRRLDLKTGILHRSLLWSPLNNNSGIELTFERFTSLEDQHILLIQVKITPISSPAEIRIRASLDSQVENDGVLHWHINHINSTPHQADLVLETRKSGKTLALSTKLSTNKEDTHFLGSDCRTSPGIEALVNCLSGETLVVQKYVSIATSREHKNPLSFSQSKVHSAYKNGYNKIRTAHLKAWENFWKVSDVIIDGDNEAQLGIRHSLFQLRIAAPTKNERVSIGAKTLSGFGYRGHVFWDTEIFILPFFILTQPQFARNMLMYRFHTLTGARRKAKENGFKGAQYSWESAETGDEVTPTWVPDFNNPLELVRIWTGDIEIHISSDIAYACYQYWQITGDNDFWLGEGIPILLETAIFWGERAESEGEHFSIRDIIGPDEYHEHVDNNAYTNFMVRWHLNTAITMVKWLTENHPAKANELIERYKLTKAKLDHWVKIRDNIVFLQDSKTGLIEQFEGFFNLKEVNLENFTNRTKSMQEILGIKKTNEHQVIKQADVIMLLCLLRSEFNKNILETNWNYYNPRTDHTYGSSLGPAFQAWAACEMGQPEIGYSHFIRALRADLIDIRGNAKDGIHAASAGGAWQAIAFGFAGLRFKHEKPIINPQLPSNWKRLVFSIVYRGVVYKIDINPQRGSVTKID